MRLSTAADRDDARGLETIRAAVVAGATLLDTADAYALDDGDAHHNERLIAGALDALAPAERSKVRVVTKGGLTRPGGSWVPDGRAVHLRRACEESAAALGAAPDLYLLHAPDPRTSFATSVRALAQLQADGLIRGAGLSNV